MANKSIIDVDTAESITQEDLFYVNSNKSLKQIKNKNLKFDYATNVINKPSINGVELCGGDGKSLNELGIGSSADIADLMQTKAGAIINSAKGERIAVGDSAGAFFEGLKLYGKTEQVRTKGYQLFDASKIATKSAGGATVTNNGDGSFTISGSGNLTSGFDSFYQLTDREEIKRMFKVGKIYLKNNGVTFPYFHAYFQSTDGSRALTIIDGKEHDLTEDILNNTAIVGFSVYANSGATITIGTIRPMLYQDGDGTWEPFTGGKPSPSMDYKQDLESSGDGGNIGLEVLRKNLCKVTSVKNASFDENTGTLVNNAKNNTIESYIKIQRYDGDNFLTEISVNNTGKTEKTFSVNGTFNRIRLAFAGDRSEGSIMMDVSYLNYGEYILSMDIEEIGTNKGRISKIMLLNKGLSDETFEPFQCRQASLSTPNGLPGIPVDSDGNYTDSNGQQWICDEMDFKRGKYVQRIKKVVFNGSEDWNLESISQKGFANFYVRNLSGIRASSNVLSNQFRNQTTVISETTEEGIANLSTLYVRIDKTKADNANKFKEILKTNNLEICYQLAAPIETDIPEETMNVYRRLYTNFPSTVIQNDSGAGMEVEYVADTKSYIGNKLKELVQAAYGSMANMLSLMPTNVQAEMIENDTNNILNNL